MLGQTVFKCTETKRVHRLKPFEKWLRDWPVFKQEPLCKPQSHKQHAIDLTDGKRPLHTIKQIKEFIRQGWRIFLGWDTFVHHWDHNCCGDEAEQSVKEGHTCFEPLCGVRRALLLNQRRNQDANRIQAQTILWKAVVDLAIAHTDIGKSDASVTVDVVPVFMVVVLVRLHVAGEAQSLKAFQKLSTTVPCDQRQRRGLKVFLGEFQEGRAVHVLQCIRVLLQAFVGQPIRDVTGCPQPHLLHVWVRVCQMAVSGVFTQQFGATITVIVSLGHWRSNFSPLLHHCC